MEKTLVVISDWNERNTVVAKVTGEQLELLEWLDEAELLMIINPVDSADFVKEEK